MNQDIIEQRNNQQLSWFKKQEQKYEQKAYTPNPVSFCEIQFNSQWSLINPDSQTNLNPKTPKCLYSIFSFHEASRFEVSQVNNTSNCLFESVKVILESIGLKYSIEHLRSVVAYTVLDVYDKATTKTILTWKAIVNQAKKDQNRKLYDDYKHAVALGGTGKRIMPVTKKDRENLYKSMLKTDYWGDSHALRVFEKRLGIRFLVLHEDGSFQLQQVDSLDPVFNPSHLAILYQDHKHFMPVSYSSQFVFNYNALPLVIKNVC